MLHFRSIKRSTSLDTGNELSTYDGVGIEFSGIREYTNSDDARLIEWRSSARNSKIYTKKFESTSALSIVLILDTHRGIYFQKTGELSKQDFLSSFLDDICLSALAYGHKLSGYSRTGNTSISKAPTSNIAEFRHIFHTHIDSSMYDTTILDTYMEELLKNKVKNTLILIITDTLELPKITPLATLSEQNDLICIHYVSPYESHPDESVIMQSGVSIGNISKLRNYREEFTKKRVQVQNLFQKYGGYVSLSVDDTNRNEKLNRYFLSRRST